jgi:hypothetical protein
MKKLILPLVLLFAIGMLAAVESDPSDVVGYVKYDMVVGNNTLALPMVEAYALASEVGNAIPGCDNVRYYNAVAQAWVAADKTPFGTWTGPEGDFAVSNGMPLWINTTTAGAFFSIGDLPATLPAYTLYVGNNFIMVPLDQSALNLAGLVGDSIPGCDNVRYYNAVAQAWVAADKTPFGTWTGPEGNFATAIADPLWINTTTAGTWPAAARGSNNFDTPSK